MKNEVKRASFNLLALLALFSSSVCFAKNFLFQQSASEAFPAIFQLTLTICFSYSCMKLQNESCFLRPNSPALHCVRALKTGHIVTMLCPCPLESNDPEDMGRLIKYTPAGRQKKSSGRTDPMISLVAFQFMD